MEEGIVFNVNLGGRWQARRLLYKISSYPPSRVLAKREVDEAMAEALKVWSDVADLEFERVEAGEAHIDIQFGQGEHGDDDPFDGRGGQISPSKFCSVIIRLLFQEELWLTPSSHCSEETFTLTRRRDGQSRLPAVSVSPSPQLMRSATLWVRNINILSWQSWHQHHHTSWHFQQSNPILSHNWFALLL